MPIIWFLTTVSITTGTQFKAEEAFQTVNTETEHKFLIRKDQSISFATFATTPMI
jgi:hypothetical protein